MKITGIRAVYFSPAGSTKLIALKVAKALSSVFCVPVAEMDITLPAAREGVTVFPSEELVVFASPTYAGRLPNKILPFFQTGFQGRNTPAVPVVTFGNRSFQDALSELALTLRERGFVSVGGVAMVCRHVFSNKLAAGRPDESDLAALERYGAGLAEQILGWEEPVSVSVPGNDPPGAYYTPLGVDGRPAKFLKSTPLTRECCDRCGKCASVCPMGSIDKDDPSHVFGICIKCQACVKECPLEAKYFADSAFLSHVAMLEKACQTARENTFV